MSATFRHGVASSEYGISKGPAFRPNWPSRPDLSLTLAQGLYQLGLGSIVELSQAQLQETDAAIGYVNSPIPIPAGPLNAQL